MSCDLPAKYFVAMRALTAPQASEGMPFVDAVKGGTSPDELDMKCSSSRGRPMGQQGNFTDVKTHAASFGDVEAYMRIGVAVHLGEKRCRERCWISTTHSR